MTNLFFFYSIYFKKSFILLPVRLTFFKLFLTHKLKIIAQKFVKKYFISLEKYIKHGKMPFELMQHFKLVIKKIILIQ
jgi:hypothetical protein